MCYFISTNNWKQSVQQGKRIFLQKTENCPIKFNTILKLKGKLVGTFQLKYFSDHKTHLFLCPWRKDFNMLDMSSFIHSEFYMLRYMWYFVYFKCEIHSVKETRMNFYYRCKCILLFSNSWNNIWYSIQINTIWYKTFVT